MSQLARLVLALALATCSRAALAQRTSVPTAFTYQGVLNDNGQAYTGLAKAEFRLFTEQALGDQVATTGLVQSINVTDGLFTVEIDFGSNALAQQADWLEIAIAKQSDPSLTVLAPRQHLGSAPFAAQAAGAIRSNNSNVLRSGTGQAAFNYNFTSVSTQIISAWQSFTTGGISGTLDSIIIPIVPNGAINISDAVVTLYKGEGGLGTGTPIATLSPFVISAFDSNLDILFDPKPILSASETYTIEVRATNPNTIKFQTTTGNLYPDGRVSFNSDHDLLFYVYMDSSQFPLVWVNPADTLRVDSAIGIGSDSTPGASITIDGSDLNLDVFEFDTFNDDIVVGGDSGVLGLYGTAYSFPARLTLSSYDSVTGLTDKWAALHTGPFGNSALELTFGTSRLPHVNPTIALFTAAGHLGLGTDTPLSMLHIADNGLVIDPTAISGETSTVSGTDAILGVVSRNIGAWGSAITLKDVNSGGNLIDTWAIIRGASPGSNLNFKYGASANAASNPTLMQLSAASGTLSIGNTSTSTGRLIVTQNADTANGGIALFDLNNSQSARLWIDAANTVRLDSGATGAGNLEINAGGGAVLIDNLVTPSTAAIKADIATLTDALTTLLQLRGVSYTKKLNGEHDIGFIAEEMARVLPEVVAFDNEGNPIGIEYAKITALTVEAIKQQQAELRSLRSALDAMAQRLDRLEAGD